MKITLLFTLVVFVAVIEVNAQFWSGTYSTTSCINRTGTVSIGGNGCWANTKLNIKGSQHWSHFFWGENEDTYIRPGKSTGRVIMDYGNVGIGTAAPTAKLHVYGTIKAFSLLDGVYRCDPNSTSNFYRLEVQYLDHLSDIRLKSNVAELSNCLDQLNQLSGISYNFKSEEKLKSSEKSTQFGFSAQEVRKVFPELVRENKDGYLAMNYIGLIPVLTEAIKEQQKQIDELKSTLAGLSDIISQHNRMYPNPIDEHANLNLTLQSDIKKAVLNIYNIDGKLVKQIKIRDRGNSTITFDTSDLPVGVYSYTLTADGQLMASSKIIKR